MKNINLFKIFQGSKTNRRIEGFSDFFLRASDEEKKKVLTEAARRANEDQREMFERAKLKINT